MTRWLPRRWTGVLLAVLLVAFSSLATGGFWFVSGLLVFVSWMSALQHDLYDDLADIATEALDGWREFESQRCEELAARTGPSDE